MKRIGLIGGMSWHSSLEYYRLLNELSAKQLGPEHCANVVMVNVDIGHFRQHIARSDEEAGYQMIRNACHSVKAAGAEVIGLCANGAHRYFERLEKDVDCKFVHIAEATGLAVRNDGCKTLGLLGVKATMEGTFYADRFKNFGIKVITPDSADRDYIDESIFKELVFGKFTKETKSKYLAIIQKLTKSGAEGIILGCTEIPLLIHSTDYAVPLYSTTELHCQMLIASALK